MHERAVLRIFVGEVFVADIQILDCGTLALRFGPLEELCKKHRVIVFEDHTSRRLSVYDWRRRVFYTMALTKGSVRHGLNIDLRGLF